MLAYLMKNIKLLKYRSFGVNFEFKILQFMQITVIAVLDAV